MWAVLNQEVSLPSCEIYTLEPDGEVGDPFVDENGSIWQQNYFFYNKNLKRIGMILLRAISKTAQTVVDGDADQQYAYGFEDEMEM